jgi:hypothetical protein
MAWLNPRLVWTLDSTPNITPSIVIASPSPTSPIGLQTNAVEPVEIEDPSEIWLNNLRMDMVSREPSSHHPDEPAGLAEVDGDRSTLLRQILLLKKSIKESMRKVNEKEQSVVPESISRIYVSDLTMAKEISISESTSASSKSSSNSPPTSTSSPFEFESFDNVLRNHRSSVVRLREDDDEEGIDCDIKRRKTIESIPLPPTSLLPPALSFPPDHASFPSSSPPSTSSILPALSDQENAKGGGVPLAVLLLYPRLAPHIASAVKFFTPAIEISSPHSDYDYNNETRLDKESVEIIDAIPTVANMNKVPIPDSDPTRIIKSKLRRVRQVQMRLQRHLSALVVS